MATVTWVRSHEERGTLVRSLTRLSEAGYPVAVADRGDDYDFALAVRRIAGVTVTVPEAAGLVPQVQASFRIAATFATRFILYAESDKEEFFAHRLQRFLAVAPTTSEVGVVLASRSEAAFDTFPAIQRYTEGVINDLCGQVTGAPGDYSYGPFLMNSTLMSHLVDLNPSLGWGWRPAIFLAAHRHGLRIAHVEDDHHCPLDQRGEDEDARTHRLRQLSQNITGLI